MGPLFPYCTSKSTLVAWAFPVINAGKVRHGFLVEISLCSATVHKVVCCYKSSEVFCSSNTMKVVLFRCTDRNHLSTLLFSAQGSSLLSVQLEGVFLVFVYQQRRNALAAGILRYHITAERQPLFKVQSAHFAHASGMT